MRHTISALAALAAVPMAVAQTFTSCNPTSSSQCSSDAALGDSSFFTDFTTVSGGTTKLPGWTSLPGTTLTYGSNGAVFTISKDGEAPTIQSDFYIFFGTTEVVMQAAPGAGIVSSIVFESDDLDELDWELVGLDTTHAQSNYYGKGNTTTYDRAVYQDVSPAPQTNFHTYKFDWSSERIIWSIDGTAVRTLHYADANGGSNFPQTPMRIRLGDWAGGCASCAEGTAEWAGGRTNYADGPFNMYIKSVKITNANPGANYYYSDMTGRWESIKVLDSNNNQIPTNSGSSSGAGDGNGGSSSSSSSPASSSSSIAASKSSASSSGASSSSSGSGGSSSSSSSSSLSISIPSSSASSSSSSLPKPKPVNVTVCATSTAYGSVSPSAAIIPVSPTTATTSVTSSKAASSSGISSSTSARRNGTSSSSSPPVATQTTSAASSGPAAAAFAMVMALALAFAYLL